MTEQALNWDDRLQYVALTDIGMRRANNQDSHAVVLAPDMEAWQKRGHFFMVADGMGAHAAGELASKLAVEGVQHLYHKYHDLSSPEALEKAIVETNSEVHRRGQANSDFYNMGTTATALVLVPQGALIAHIGDSRVYRLRGDQLQQLTRDHSLVWELREHLADNGDLAIPKNVITRSLGPNPSVQVDIEGPLAIDKGDTFLVCSDGLTGRIPDEELAVFLKHLAPSEAGPLLLDLANLRGGPDNITVLIAKVISDELATQAAQPLRSATKSENVALPPALWVCLGVCLLAAIVLGITGNPIPAVVAASGAIVSLLLVLHSRQRKRSTGVPPSGDRRLRGGPYTQTQCPPTADSRKMLRGLADELRNSIRQEELPVDWSTYDVHCRAAEQSEDAARAIACYAQALRELMRQVRDTQNQKANDSNIEY